MDEESFEFMVFVAAAVLLCGLAIAHTSYATLESYVLVPSSLSCWRYISIQLVTNVQ